ncbi:uncharacterized protein CLUP02_03672 [Colletotrichum lupini]|uniref:Uncharacterized protein n=1 Tax=Colletotrichum lupini TaxID=145971 RepID=A0A9Q8SIX8_9PEZI|nr:uncharacterized protein CLUP02_03672 [Colletotrichum lupini]UQC78196.1 hypothetical protein CLUP02_03672 [Colletotrichum lupini]
MGIKRGGRKSPRQEEVARGVVVRLEEGAGHWRNGTAHESPARNKVTVQLRRRRGDVEFAAQSYGRRGGFEWGARRIGALGPWGSLHVSGKEQGALRGSRTRIHPFSFALATSTVAPYSVLVTVDWADCSFFILSDQNGNSSTGPQFHAKSSVAALSTNVIFIPSKASRTNLIAFPPWLTYIQFSSLQRSFQMQRVIISTFRGRIQSQLKAATNHQTSQSTRPKSPVAQFTQLRHSLDCVRIVRESLSRYLRLATGIDDTAPLPRMPLHIFGPLPEAAKRPMCLAAPPRSATAARHLAVRDLVRHALGDPACEVQGSACAILTYTCFVLLWFLFLSFDTISIFAWSSAGSWDLWLSHMPECFGFHMNALERLTVGERRIHNLLSHHLRVRERNKCERNHIVAKLSNDTLPRSQHQPSVVPKRKVHQTRICATIRFVKLAVGKTVGTISIGALLWNPTNEIVAPFAIWSSLLFPCYRFAGSCYCRNSIWSRGHILFDSHSRKIALLAQKARTVASLHFDRDNLNDKIIIAEEPRIHEPSNSHRRDNSSQCRERTLRKTSMSWPFATAISHNYSQHEASATVWFSTALEKYIHRQHNLHSIAHCFTTTFKQVVTLRVNNPTEPLYMVKRQLDGKLVFYSPHDSPRIHQDRALATLVQRATEVNLKHEISQRILATSVEAYGAIESFAHDSTGMSGLLDPLCDVGEARSSHSPVTKICKISIRYVITPDDVLRLCHSYGDEWFYPLDGLCEQREYSNNLCKMSEPRDQLFPTSTAAVEESSFYDLACKLAKLAQLRYLPDEGKRRSRDFLLAVLDVRRQRTTTNTMNFQVHSSKCHIDGKLCWKVSCLQNSSLLVLNEHTGYTMDIILTSVSQKHWVRLSRNSPVGCHEPPLKIDARSLSSDTVATLEIPLSTRKRESSDYRDLGRKQASLAGSRKATQARPGSQNLKDPLRKHRKYESRNLQEQNEILSRVRKCCVMKVLTLIVVLCRKKALMSYESKSNGVSILVALLVGSTFRYAVLCFSLLLPLNAVIYILRKIIANPHLFMLKQLLRITIRSSDPVSRSKRHLEGRIAVWIDPLATNINLKALEETEHFQNILPFSKTPKASAGTMTSRQPTGRRSTVFNKMPGMLNIVRLLPQGPDAIHSTAADLHACPCSFSLMDWANRGDKRLGSRVTFRSPAEDQVDKPVAHPLGKSFNEFQQDSTNFLGRIRSINVEAKRSPTILEEMEYARRCL